MAITLKVIECSISKDDFEQLLKGYVFFQNSGLDRHYIQLQNNDFEKFKIIKTYKQDLDFGKVNRYLKNYTFKHANKNLELFLLNKDILVGCGSSKFILKNDFLNPLERPMENDDMMYFVLINF